MAEKRARKLPDRMRRLINSINTGSAVIIILIRCAKAEEDGYIAYAQKRMKKNPNSPRFGKTRIG